MPDYSNNYHKPSKFRFWCQKVLPLVYDESLSYYELLNKIVVYINNLIQDNSATISNVEALLASFEQLQEYVNTFVDNLDITAEVEAKIDAMADNGGLLDIMTPYIDTQIDEVENTLNTTIQEAFDEQDSYNEATRTSVNSAIGEQTQYNIQTRTMVQNTYSGPRVAETASDMTDTSLIYVYTGSESGYLNGYWYYYNGSSWTAGGIYNATQIGTDPTFTELGEPADALVTGEYLTALSEGEPFDLKWWCEWEIGTLDGLTGEELTSTTRIRTGFINVQNFSTLDIGVDSGYKYVMDCYDSGYNFLADESFNSWRISNATKTLEDNVKFVRLLVATTSDSEASLDFSSNIFLLGTPITQSDANTMRDDITEIQGDIITLESDVSDLKEDLTEQLGSEVIQMVANKYVDLSGDTVTMSGGSPAYSGTSAAYSCGIISCESGDNAIINGTGGGQTRLWGFVDSSGNVLEKANSSATAENLVLTAPDNTAFLIVHTNNAKISYKGFSKIDSAEKSTVNMLVLEQGGLRLADGVEKDMTTRVRTITKVTKPMRIVCPTGIIVSGAFYYRTADDSFDSTVAYESQIADINIVSGTYARLVFAKADTTADISVSDMVGLDTITIFYNDIEALKLAEKTNILNVICLEMGSINVSGVYVDSTTRVRTVTRFTDSITLTCPDGVVVFRVYYFNVSDDTLSRFAELRTQSATISPASGEYAVVIFSKTDTTETIGLSDIKGIDTMEMFNARLDALEDLNVPPMVEFSYDHDLYDCTATMTSKPYSNDMTTIYGYFDELVSGHSDYVSKTDIAETLGLTYPTYANGNYDSTPAYKTYMYSFVCSNENVNTSNQTKKKLLLIGATHGDEQATPYNLYIFAKRLCEESLTNDNIFKLRSAYDIYIIPVLNGYGYYNTQRVNGNGVDINRNYPIAKWTEADAGNTHYTGASAGSEFETQIIMGVIENYNLNMLVDHHNYAYNLAWQFYTEVNTEDALKLSYQSAVDCSYAFKKNLPAYFGTSFDFVINRSGSAAPGVIASDSTGTTSRYAYEQGVPFSATVEISNCINYLDGVHANTAQDLNGETTFSVGQYTLFNQVLRYGQYALVR